MGRITLTIVFILFIFLTTASATVPEITYAGCTYAIAVWENSPNYVDIYTPGGVWLEPTTGLKEIVSVPLNQEFGYAGTDIYWSAVYIDQLDNREWKIIQAYVYNIYGGIMWFPNVPNAVKCEKLFLPFTRK